MKKFKFGARVLALVLTFIMVISIVPMPARAAVHDITTGSYRGTVGADVTTFGEYGEINWPVKIYDYHNDGMLFEYSASWQMDGSVADESRSAEKGGLLYGGGDPMPVTKIGVDYTGNAAYESNAYAGLNGIKNSAGVAIASNYTLSKRPGPPQYLRLTAKNSAGTDNSGRANNFFIADFAVDQGGAVAKADARYMVMAYTARGLDVSTTPFSIFITSDSGHTTYKRGNLDSSYGITNGTSKWKYVVIDLQKVLSSHWSSIEKFYGLGISVKLDYLSSNTDLLCLSHVAFFNNKAEAERYGQKAVAFDNNPGEYLGNLTTHKWNLGNNLPYGLLMAAAGGGWSYWIGGDSTNTDSGYNSYRIGYTPYGDDGSNQWLANYHRKDSSGNLIGNSTQIYYVEGDTLAANADYMAKYPKDYKNGFNTADLDFDGYDLLTHVTSGQISMGLLEGQLKDGRPVYRQETVEYLADVIRRTLIIPQKAPDGDFNLTYLSGKKDASTYGTDAAGNALDLPQALRNQLGVTFTEGNRRGSTPTLGKYTTTVKKADQLTGKFTDCVGNITSCMDAAYYLLNNLFVSNSYNQLQNDYRYLTLSGAMKDGQQVYIFDAGLTNGAQNQKDNPLSGMTQAEYKAASQSAVEYSSYNKGGDGTISLGKVDAKDLFYYAYDANNPGEGITTRYPFLPVTDAEGTYAGETESYYFLDDGFRSNASEFDSYANRNYNYVLASNGEFVYNQTDDLFFEFEGDDDVYLFINDQLVLDLGGAHPISKASFKVNDYVKWAQSVLENPADYTSEEVARAHALDLEDGEIVKFDFFYMERHGYGANMRIMTNMHITDPDMRVEKTAYQGATQIEYGGIIDGEYPVEYNFTLNNSGNTKLYNLSFDDSDIGVKLNPADGLLVAGDDTESDSDDINGYYVTDARGERLDPQDLTAIVSGYEPVDKGGDYLLVGDDYQKVEDGSGTHKYVEITVNFTNNSELRSFLRTLQGNGLDNTTVDDELTQKGSGLWVDASVTFKGIYYNLTSAQKKEGVFNNTVHVQATSRADADAPDSETLRSEDNHRVYLTAIPLFYQWAGHNLFISEEAVLLDATKESGNTGSMLHEYKDFFTAVDGDTSKIVIRMSDWDGTIKTNNYYDHVVREKNAMTGVLGFTTSYPDVGTYEFYVTMRLAEHKDTPISDLNKDEYAIVRVLIFVTDVNDSTYVLDYGLKTENLDANGELFKTDELLGASSGVEAKLMAVTDGANGVPFYRDPNEYESNQNRITFKETVLGDDKKVMVTGSDGSVDGYYNVNLNIPETGKKISYDKYSRTYSITNSGTTMVHVEAPPAWETIYLYYWYDNGVNNVWPGTPMNKTSTGSSSLAIPGNVPHIIISNGVNQTINLDINVGQDLWIDMSEGKLDSAGRIEAKLTYGTTDGIVHAKVPEGWGDVYLYSWDTFYNELETWPGTKIEDIDEEGYFTASVPGDITNVIINNGNEDVTDNRKQTVDLSIAAGKETWITVNNVPMENTYAPQMYTAVATQSLESVMMHATVPASWNDAYLYYWNSNGRPTGIEWPGLKMENTSGSTYSLEVPADVENVIISDGTSRQTENLDVSAGLETWITVKDVDDEEAIFATVPNDWGDVYIYFFNDNGAVGTEWPGVKAINAYGNTYFTSVPFGAQKYIVNNNNSFQTQDLLLIPGKTTNINVAHQNATATTDSQLTITAPDTWETVNIYAWNTGTNEKNAEWPGEAITPNGDGKYIITIDKKFNKFIINNGTIQTSDMSLFFMGDESLVTVYDDGGCTIGSPSSMETKYSATIAYGQEGEDEGFTFVPTDFMDSEYSIWLAVSVHETDINPTPLLNPIDIGKEVQMFKKVTVLPADVVYYEDDFAGIKYNYASGNVITHYSDGSGGLKQNVDQSQEYGQDKVYQGSENNEITGGSMTDVYINNTDSFASFEFTGTGVEIVGHTHAVGSGTLVVTVYDENGNRVKRIPVITEFDNGANGGSESISYVPLVRINGLTFGTYKVELSGVPVYDFTDFDYTKYDPNDPSTHPPVAESYLCIDGIRVYQPIATDGVNGSHDSYLENEDGATFIEVRELIANRKAFAVKYTEDGGLSVSGGTNTWIENRNNFLPSDSTVGWTNHTVNSILDYILAGPNNEIYLLESTDEDKSAVAFYVTETDGADVHNMQIAVRAMDYNAFVGSGISGKMEATVQYGSMEDGKLVWKPLITTVSSSEQYYTIPYKDCPYDEKNDRYQVVLRVADSAITGMASFTNLKYNGIELNQLNTSEIPDVIYDELYADIMDSSGNTLDSSKFVNFISISEQMTAVAVASETETTPELKGVYSYSRFKPIVDSITGHTAYDFTLTDKTRFFIVSDGTPSQELIDTVKLAQKQFAADGYVMDVVWGTEAAAETGDIVIKMDSSYAAEQYNLVVKLKAELKASDMRGVLYGLNMLQKHFRFASAYLESNPNSTCTPHTIKGFTLTDAPDTKERTVHLDMGRKYFTKDWICNYIREMSWMGYNSIELHFSEDGGFRIDFWDNTTDFTSPTGNDFSWVCGGQKPSFNYQADDSGYDYSQYLSAAEVKEICQVAKEYHIDIIPSFDTPAHVDWLTTAYKQQGNSTFYYNGTKYTLPSIINYRGSYSIENSKCLNLGDANVQKFAFAMYTDIAEFFKQYAGSTKFNICGDEVLLSNKSTDGWDYADFVDYVNNLNTLLKNKGYTVRMYNDFADRDDYASKASRTVANLASDIEIIFWDGPDSSSAGIKAASHWVDDDRNIYSGDQNWTYYVLHRMDNPSSETWLKENGYWNMDTRNPACTVMLYTRNDEQTVYNEWNPTMLYDYGKTAYTYSGNQLAGGYFMIWCNYAALNTEVEMWNGVTDKYDSSQHYSLLDRMWANVIKQWNWDVNADTTYATYEELFGYMGDFPGLDTSTTGCSKPATLNEGKEAYGPILPKYTVTFMDFDGRVISTQTVIQGGSAVAPEAPSRFPSGNYSYTFSGWDKSYTNIQADTTVVAEYTEKAIVDAIGKLEIKLVGGSNISVAVGKGAARPVGMEYASSSMPSGTKLTLIAENSADNKFVGWFNAITGSLLTSSETYTFYTSGNDVIMAVYETDIPGMSLVTFKNDKTNQVIDMMYYSTSDTSVSFPADPACPGYEFMGWSYTEAEILKMIAAGQDVTVVPRWNENNKYVSVKINGGMITKQSHSNEDGQHLAYKAVTVTANPPETGYLFAYWVDAVGKIVSYSAEYKFYPCEDTELTAIYLEKNKVDINIVDTFKPETSDDTDGTKTVYFVNNWLWTDVCVHYWGAQSTSWPGVSMTLMDEKSYDGFDMYSVEIPAGVTGIIFNGINNDGSGTRNQSPDITDFADGKVYRMGWDNGNQALTDDNKTLYVSLPNGTNDKVFAAYVWNSINESTWIDITEQVTGNLYKVVVPSKFTNIIIASLADGTKPAGWDNVATQSVDLSLITESDYFHMFAELDDSNNYTGQWGKMTTVYFRNSKNWSNIRVDYTTAIGSEQDKTTGSFFVDMETGVDNLYAVLIPADVATISFTNSETTDGVDYTYVVTDKTKLDNAIFDLEASLVAVDYAVITDIAVDTQTYKDKNEIVFSWSVPEQTGYTFVNAGLLLVEESGFVESNFNMNSVSSGLTVFTPASKYQTSTGTHVLSHKVAAGSTWKVRVFVQYRDADGNLRTAYSDIATAKK